MAESPTITRTAPDVKSMDYALLREKGIARLQELAGEIWTDFNIHDPGVTILEALAYAITDLGYRSNYKIQDILALDPSSSEDIRNFFSAYEILTNRALTLNDYRKLLMDIQVTDPVTGAKAGVKNAWLQKAPMQEIPFYVHANENRLSYDPDPFVPPVQAPVKLKGLYNVLLELDFNTLFGDMNESFMTAVLKVEDDGCVDPRLVNANIVVEVNFPKWDTPGIDWNDQNAITGALALADVKLDFSIYPDNFLFNYTLDPVTNQVVFTQTLCGEDTNRDGIVDVTEQFSGLTCLAGQINTLIFDPVTGFIPVYQQKVKLIYRLMAEVRRTLMANRNLCEDFLRISTVKVEEIALCGDIQVENEADIEEVLANIYHEVGKVLSPTVFFRTIDELVARGKTMDEIFEGPRLRHGFIDDDELNKASMRQNIHVSDLYQIIMDVPGVVAVKDLQVANIPEDPDPNVTSLSVKWCLGLAFDRDYVPRVSVERSNITCFKDVLPFEADKPEVITRLNALLALDPPQRLENPVLDLPVPQGEFKSIDSYTSVQEEFPLVYGIGPAGLPGSASALRKAQAHQLKGFLMFFDQLLADYLSQLSHIKDLFSLTETRDPDGNFVIGRTYFTQSLISIVPNAADLYINSQPVHADHLNQIAESLDLFESRRNRFLDHLMARFGETFADYAMLAYTLDGPKAPDELIEDKLRFLNSYPAISYGRAGAMDYANTCMLWNADNVSGLEKRVALLTGIDPFDPSDLVTPLYTVINDTLGDAPFSFTARNLSNVPLMSSFSTYSSLDDTMLAVEKAIVAGMFPENYLFFDPANPAQPLDVDPLNPPVATNLFYRLYCVDGPLAQSINPGDTYANLQVEIQALVAAYTAEYNRDHSTNRKDVDCDLENYLVSPVGMTNIPATATCPEGYTLTFTLTNNRITNGDPLLTYTTTVSARPGEDSATFYDRVVAQQHDILLEFLLRATNPDNYRFETSGPSYYFAIFDSCRATVATSAEVNFNDNLAAFIGTPAGNTISFYDAGGGFTGSSTVVSASPNTDAISVVTAAAAPAGTAKIGMSFTNTAIASTDISRKSIVINEDLRGRVKEGDLIEATTNGTDYDALTVVHVEIIDFASSKTRVTVKEAIPGTYISIRGSFTLPVISVSGTTLTLKGGVDDIAIQQFIDFIKTKFLSHEGFHLLEHILLRPLLSGQKVFTPATVTTLKSGLTNYGRLYFVRDESITAVNTAGKIFTVGVDITADLSFNQQILVSGSASGTNDGTYTVVADTLNAGSTDIQVYESIPVSTLPYGSISYTKDVPIGSVVPNQMKIVLSGINIASDFLVNDVIIISGSDNGANDTRYKVGSAVYTGTDTEIVVSEVEVLKQDKLLPINRLADCDNCRYDDPYSFVVSVVMPYWRGRFSNLAFRKFFERTLRLEMPAHVVLNICWVNCEQMGKFEKAYRAWLYQHARRDRDLIALSDALNTLIDSLRSLFSVYPKGNLHDCDAGADPTNSIVLNQSILGNL